MVSSKHHLRRLASVERKAFSKRLYYQNGNQGRYVRFKEETNNGSTAQHAGDERQQNVKHYNFISVKGN